MQYFTKYNNSVLPEQEALLLWFVFEKKSCYPGRHTAVWGVYSMQSNVEQTRRVWYLIVAPARNKQQQVVDLAGKLRRLFVLYFQNYKLCFGTLPAVYCRREEETNMPPARNL